MVIISKKNRKAIYEYIFKEGVITVQKAPHKEKHEDIDVPNLHVMMLVKSLVSKGFLKETFNWQWHYCFLTNEGIDHLREVLALPAHMAPVTLTKQRAQKPLASAMPQTSGGEERRGKGKGGWGGGKGSWGKGDRGDRGGDRWGGGGGGGYGGGNNWGSGGGWNNNDWNQNQNQEQKTEEAPAVAE